MLKPYIHNEILYYLFDGYWTLEDLRDNPQLLFVFGDNTKRYGNGGQAIVRFEPNAIGLATKGAPLANYSSYWRDDTYDSNVEYIDSDIKRIKEVAAANEQTLVFAAGGYGTGLAYLNETAPKTFDYLCGRLQDEFGFDNVTALGLYK